jgi:hypothetical protein
MVSVRVRVRVSVRGRNGAVPASKTERKRERTRKRKEKQTLWVLARKALSCVEDSSPSRIALSSLARVLAKVSAARCDSRER